MIKNFDYDILIVGAGNVGLALACALQPSGLRIGLLDQHTPALKSLDAKTYDLRVSAITRASQQILTNIGVWSELARDRIAPFYKMHVWDAIGTGSLDFSHPDIDGEVLGHIIENNNLQNALSKKINDFSNINFIAATSLENFSITDQDVTVHLANGAVVTCGLLVGADGGDSKVRQLAHINVTSWNYGHTALVCNVKTSLPHQHTAWQRFLSTGPLAFLPLADPQWSSIVWSTDPDNAANLVNLDPKEFKQTLADAFAYRLGSILEISDRAIFPLKMRHTTHYVKPQLALVGDAAHTIHPLAGQGLNLGLLDAACLAETILNAHAKKHALGSLTTLRRYERWRKSENLTMISFVEAIKRLFSQGANPLRTLANVGFTVTNQCDPLKNFFVRHALGLTGDLPKLAAPIYK